MEKLKRKKFPFFALVTARDPQAASAFWCLEETNKRKETRVSGEGPRAVHPEMGAVTLYLTPPHKSLDLSYWNILVILIIPVRL